VVYCWNTERGFGFIRPEATGNKQQPGLPFVSGVPRSSNGGGSHCALVTGKRRDHLVPLQGIEGVPAISITARARFEHDAYQERA
jgi:hypothetical protein